MQISYKQDERGMMIPDFQAPQKILPSGKYGTMRMEYLYQNYRHRYDQMLLDGTLNDHLQETQSRALDRLIGLTQRMERYNPPSQEMSFQERTAHFREIHLAAERMVLEEIVYRP